MDARPRYLQLDVVDWQQHYLRQYAAASKALFFNDWRSKPLEQLMSLRYLCDGGCGAVTDDPENFKKFGFAHETHYCEKCAPGVEKMIADRDKLHDKLAEAWWKGLAKLEGDWEKKHADGRLPDVAP